MMRRTPSSMAGAPTGRPRRAPPKKTGPSLTEQLAWLGVFLAVIGGLVWVLWPIFSILIAAATAAYLLDPVADKLEGICARTGLERFHIVGHSKGGIIARYYVQHLGGDKRTKSLITLGSPHHGTPTAAIGVGLMAGGLISRSPLQMLPGSPLMRLLKKDTFPPGIPLTSVYSRHDVVCPWWCSVLRPRQGETSMFNHEVTKVGHTALTTDPTVYQLVRRELDRASKLWRERRTR